MTKSGKDGRIYIRLELEALKKALQLSSDNEKVQQLKNALIFRKYRNLLFPDSGTTENLLELNEGIASYTGLIISDRNREQAIQNLINWIYFANNFPSFVWSFAYATTPVYGFFLYMQNPDWNKKISYSTNLTEYFLDAFDIEIPTDLKTVVEKISNDYNGEVIFEEETTRDEEKQRLIRENRNKFVESPHLAITLEKMSISFDPSTAVPIDDLGSVFPNIRVVDVWGILTVENGALISKRWNKVTVTAPITIREDGAVGDGWVLELTENYSIEKDVTSGNYILKSK